MIYLDTSAAAKAVFDERGTDLVRDLFASGADLISSRLLAVELHAVVDRQDADPGAAHAVLSRVALTSLDDAILARAIDLRSGLRTLDALHLATALYLGGIVTSYLGFDRGLTEAMRRHGVPLHAAAA